MTCILTGNLQHEDISQLLFKSDRRVTRATILAPECLQFMLDAEGDFLTVNEPDLKSMSNTLVDCFATEKESAVQLQSWEIFLRPFLATMFRPTPKSYMAELIMNSTDPSGQLLASCLLAILIYTECTSCEGLYKPGSGDNPHELKARVSFMSSREDYAELYMCRVSCKRTSQDIIGKVQGVIH
ncbi:hypothetical protein Mapa_007017 [Marchantia paleacea]|nr:hypothetical protein Mapa_007017 [Marchantia paleacea]